MGTVEAAAAALAAATAGQGSVAHGGADDGQFAKLVAEQVGELRLEPFFVAVGPSVGYFARFAVVVVVVAGRVHPDLQPVGPHLHFPGESAHFFEAQLNIATHQRGFGVGGGDFGGTAKFLQKLLTGVDSVHGDVPKLRWA